MDQQRLDAIRARCEAATPGEWRAYEERFDPCGVELQIYDTNGWAKDLGPIAVLDLHCGQTDNAAFIAHARTDVPDMLDEVDRLTVELADVRKNYAIIRDKSDDLRGQALTLTAENVRLGKEVVTQTKHTIQARKRRDEAIQDYGTAVEMLSERTQERDAWRVRAEALHEDLKRYPTCNTCKHDKQIERGRWLFSSPDCECCMDDDDRPAWEWRGLREGKPDATKEASHENE
jgi:hypothetical protein